MDKAGLAARVELTRLTEAKPSRGQQGAGVGVSSCTHRDVTVDDQQLLPRHVELAAQLVGLPVDDAESLVVRVENGLQELQLGLQPRHRHVPPRISGRAAGGGRGSAGGRPRWSGRVSGGGGGEER